MKTVQGTHQVYAIRAEHTPDLYMYTPGLYKHILGLNKHIPDSQKPYRVHLRSIQAAPSIPLVYTSILQIYTSRTGYIPILYKQCRAHPRSVQAMPSPPQVYTSRAEHILGVYKP